MYTRTHIHIHKNVKKIGTNLDPPLVSHFAHAEGRGTAVLRQDMSAPGKGG